MINPGVLFPHIIFEHIVIKNPTEIAILIRNCVLTLVLFLIVKVYMALRH